VTWLIYGANGYTGELCAREAVRRHQAPILAGRSATAVRELATELTLPHRSFGLDDPAELRRGLEDVSAVLHCAGPFVRTSAPMIDACLATGTHYLDITGEITVFEAAFRRHGEARKASVTLLPGVGFDVVPTDCIAARLAEAMPDATHLELGFARDDWVFSHGSFKTALEMLPSRGAVRRDGEICTIPLADELCRVDLGDGVRWAMTLPWGDVATAYFTTGIPNVKVLYCAPVIRYFILRWIDPWLPLYAQPEIKQLMRAWSDLVAPGPEILERSDSRTLVWGEVRNDSGDSMVCYGQTLGVYALTVESALECCRRVLGNGLPAGAWTPAKAFGSDLAEALPDVTIGPVVPGRVPRRD